MEIIFSGSLFVALLAVCGAAVAQQAQVKERPIPQVVKKDGRYALMVDGAPFLMLGAQAHNSSGWPAMLPKVWPAIEYLHANTLEIPVYWEQFEAHPGQFDFSVVDTIITQAREHHVRLDLLWFGTWKNGSQHYMPEWMKADPAKYFHLIDKNGRPADSPSPFCTASQELDIRAFTAFMRHLKAFDPQRTVIIVQVENESGTWGSTRDYSPAAQKLFEAPVPAEVLKAMGKPGGAPANWQDAFGVEAEVNFHAWAVATYVGKVAAAGKAVYPLPLYANAALRDPIKPGAPGSYEAGGPTDNVIPIWKVAAPAHRYRLARHLHERSGGVPEGSGTVSPRRQSPVHPRNQRQRLGGPVLLLRARPSGDRLLALRPGLQHAPHPLQAAAAAAALPRRRTNSPPRRRTTG